MKRTLSVIYVAAFVFFLFTDAVVNSEAYRHRLGVEWLNLLSIGLGVVFWVWMLVHLLAKVSRGEIKRPWLWVVFVVLTYVIGAFVYYVVIYYPSVSKGADPSRDRIAP